MSPEPSDDELALLRSIEAAPDDDLPRLVYADWLDEHDRPIRAEYIRVECELEAIFRQLPKLSREERRGFQTRLQQLKSREHQLTRFPIEIWLGIAKELFKHFRLISRGFVEWVRVIGFVEFTTVGNQLIEIVPRPKIEFFYGNESYTPDAMPTESEQMTQELWDGMNSFAVMHYHSQFPAELLPWMNQFHYPNLTEVDLNETAMEEIDYEQFCRLRIPNLKQLDLRDNTVGLPSISLLVDSVLRSHSKS